MQNAGVQPLQVTPEQQWQFGSAVFQALPARFVGYQSLEQANQIMLNYRAAPPGQMISLQQVLSGQVKADMVRDRIVLVGYTAPVPRDSFDTPYGEMAGIWIHAHLSDLIQVSSREGARPLELLVLSACETARGDDRAVLGLAGLATRTGTRSVLSTLWVAQDIPNTDFMAQFYKALSQPGLTKAEAVRQAQLELIQTYGHTTPHIWANYILIGNWL